VLLSNRKLYPTCGQVHPALDMIIQGIQSGEISVSDLKKIQVSASFHTLKLMRYQRPEDVHQARFCIPFCVGTALATGDVTVADFTPARIDNHEIGALMDKVDVYLHPELATKEQFEALYTKGLAFTEIEVIHHNRPVFRGKQRVARGNHTFPVPKERWQKKFLQCANVALNSAESTQLWDTLTSLENVTWAQVSALL
jgi:2-methylcitrate dehydratase PrpD